ncbi:MAG: hypothetical protein CVV24_11060 [Ignavibacteriae bacterium HGW-Ignavibacteriae-3]|nr:MAG: hypothetical protein CVV24_11060 [Ignavibacteriae bacterium HGW-Ignavibacteriae-3]
MNLLNYLFSSLVCLFLFACSSSQESIQQSQKKEPDVYVFDDVKKQDSVKTDAAKQIEITAEPAKTDAQVPVIPSSAKYHIQVGVFTSLDRAQLFVRENQKDIPYLLNISVRESDKRYIIRLKPFETREEAEKVKNSIRQNSAFKDAFIVTIE